MGEEPGEHPGPKFRSGNTQPEHIRDIAILARGLHPFEEPPNFTLSARRCETPFWWSKLLLQRKVTQK